MKLVLAAVLLLASLPGQAQPSAQAKHLAAVAKKRSELEPKVSARVGVIVYENTPYTANALGLTMPCYKAKTEKGETALWYLREEMLVDSLERDVEYAKQDERAVAVINPNVDRGKVAAAESDVERRRIVLDAIGELAHMYGGMLTYDLGLHRFPVKEGSDFVAARCR